MRSVPLSSVTLRQLSRAELWFDESCYVASVVVGCGSSGSVAICYVSWVGLCPVPLGYVLSVESG